MENIKIFQPENHFLLRNNIRGRPFNYIYWYLFFVTFISSIYLSIILYPLFSLIKIINDLIIIEKYLLFYHFIFFAFEELSIFQTEF